MLQSIRDGLGRHKWVAWIALLPIALIFVVWGGSNSLNFTGISNRDAVEVDGDSVPAEEAREQWVQEQARWSQQIGTEMPPEQKKRIQQGILDQLALIQVVKNRLAHAHYGASDASVHKKWATLPAFQTGGKYDPKQARFALQQMNKTEAKYKEETRTDLMLEQLDQGITGSYFLTRGEAQRLRNLENEEREVQYVKFAADQFTASDPIDEAAIKEYQQKNADRFMTIESASIEYAELRLETLAAQFTPSETDLRKYYDENRASYVLEERRRPRHILITAEGDDDEAARKQAEAVLAEARAGQDFGELAKKYSKDSSTAANGGDLDFVLHSAFPGPFGDALFEMKVGEIIGPVKSQSGYHIIKLDAIQAKVEKPFEDVRAEIDSQYRTDQAAQAFSDRQDAISAALEKGEKDLDKLAQTLNLTRGSVREFLRGGGAEPLGSSRELQQAVFSDETLNQGKIGGPVALGEDRFVIVKVSAHHKAEPKPLAAVREEIVGLLRKERGVTAAKTAAEAALPKLEAGEKLDALAASLKLTTAPARFVGRGDPSIPAALGTAIFEAPRPEGKPVVKMATLDDGSPAVFVLTGTRTADTSANPQITQQQNALLLRRAALGDTAAYVSEIKRKADIVKNPAVFEQ